MRQALTHEESLMRCIPNAAHSTLPPPLQDTQAKSNNYAPNIGPQYFSIRSNNCDMIKQSPRHRSTNISNLVNHSQLYQPKYCAGETVLIEYWRWGWEDGF